MKTEYFGLIAKRLGGVVIVLVKICELVLNLELRFIATLVPSDARHRRYTQRKLVSVSLIMLQLFIKFNSLVVGVRFLPRRIFTAANTQGTDVNIHPVCVLPQTTQITPYR